MDSLLYLGAGNDDDDDDDDEEEEEEEAEAEAEVPTAQAKDAVVVDFAALERAGYKAARKLTETETYQRLGEQMEEQKQAEEAKQAMEAEEKAARQAAIEKMQSDLLDVRKIDERIGYKKRYAETGEDFRSKEKRKRERGQQASAGDYVQEEKRRLRHGADNFDS
eukprot:CAMPEP_0174701930 /NCGR_PEP_ID=MMETSP1094-20130205/6397_1 /TAXON_ID=156173 /ORGANISM="Chrysochromulina brevifilum, Strain UTEX LB 985" /LENGTH=164 /DNA_ID=CAMNT_0015899641 /DNA_START=129 /DNA_END=623 /DNA_ORIENTATION=-